MTFIWVCAWDLELAVASKYDAGLLTFSYVLCTLPLTFFYRHCGIVDFNKIFDCDMTHNVRYFLGIDRHVKMCDTVFTVVNENMNLFRLLWIHSAL